MDFNGVQIRIFPDLSSHTLYMQRQLRPLLDAIQNAGSTYRWGHPFHVIILRRGETFMLRSPQQLGEVFCFLNIPSVDVPDWLEVPGT